MKSDAHKCGCGMSREAQMDMARRRLLTAAAASGAAATLSGTALNAATPDAREHYADPADPGLPLIDMQIEPGRTALVVVDPQVDFLDGGGVAWGVVGESVSQQGVVDNLAPSASTLAKSLTEMSDMQTSWTANYISSSTRPFSTSTSKTGKP